MDLCKPGTSGPRGCELIYPWQGISLLLFALFWLGISVPILLMSGFIAPRRFGKWARRRRQGPAHWRSADEALFVPQTQEQREQPDQLDQFGQILALVLGSVFTLIGIAIAAVGIAELLA